MKNERSGLSGLADQYESRLSREFNSWAIPYVDRAVLDELESISEGNQEAISLVKEIESLFAEIQPGHSRDKLNRFRSAYSRAVGLTFPSEGEFRRVHELFGGIASDWNLDNMRVEKLREFDLLARTGDKSMSLLCRSLMRNFRAIRTVNKNNLRQLLEVYSECLVYSCLRKTGIEISKIPESEKSSPDFRCSCDGKVFFIEVKTFDIASPDEMHARIQEESLDANIDMEQQRAKGNGVAIGERVIRPYFNGSDDGYDATSIRLVVETLSGKAESNFKPSQFQCGPTFALISMLRLVPPHGNLSTLVPYFLDESDGGCVVAGAYWHVAFARKGYLSLKPHEFEGKGNVDGVLGHDGFLNGDIPAIGLLFFESRGQDEHSTLGLIKRSPDVSGWSGDMSEEVLYRMSIPYNDDDNSQGFKYSRYPLPGGS